MSSLPNTNIYKYLFLVATSTAQLQLSLSAIYSCDQTDDGENMEKGILFVLFTCCLFKWKCSFQVDVFLKRKGGRVCKYELAMRTNKYACIACL